MKRLQVIVEPSFVAVRGGGMLLDIRWTVQDGCQVLAQTLANVEPEQLMDSSLWDMVWDRAKREMLAALKERKT